MSQVSLRVAQVKTHPSRWLRRFIAFTPLTVSTLHLLVTVTFPIFHYERFLDKAMRELEGRGVLRRWLDQFYGFFWQHVTPDQIAQQEIGWNQIWAVGYLLVSIIFCWLVLRWDEAKYVISGLNVILCGVIYTLIPVDVLPDFIPTAGTFDDVIILLISAGTGLTVLGEGGKKRQILKKVRSSAEKKPLQALEILCEEYGLELEILPDSKKSR
jgi:uncharacterized membrane protein YkvA (DUF1232 family)